MTCISLIGATGGAGATTLAAVMALTVAEFDGGGYVEIVGDEDETKAVVGGQLESVIAVSAVTGEAAFSVRDAGTLAGGARRKAEDDQCWLVLRGPSYTGLRRAARAVNGDGMWFERVVLLVEPGRALRTTDVTTALGLPVTEIPFDLAVARCIDAGLLASRPPKSMSLVRELVAGVMA